MRFPLLLLLLAALGGCTQAFRGAPPGSLDEPSPPTQSSPDQENDSAADATAGALRACEDVKCVRDESAFRMMLIDQRYAEFVQQLRQEKTGVDFATGIAGLVVGLAGTLADNVAAKTHYAAAGTLISGSDAVANQTLYFEQTVIALISAMDASRAAVRVNLMRLLAAASDESPVQDVYAGLVAYERAGTLLGGIGYIQATSEAARKNSEDDLRDIYPLTLAQRDHKTCVSNSLLASAALTGPKLLALAGAVGIQEVAATEELSEEQANELRLRLRAFNRDGTPDQTEQLYAALEAQGVLASCPKSPPADAE